MSYKKEQFDGCAFNPMVELKMQDAYPKICEIIKPEYKEDMWLDNVLRYIIMIYDPRSPLITDERDLNRRKGMAAGLAGFDMEEEDYLSELYLCKLEYMPVLVVHYLQRFARSMDWSIIVATEHCFWESMVKLMEPISGKDSKAELESVQKKSAIKAEIDADVKRLEAYYLKFFGGDTEMEKKVRKRATPEGIANTINK